MPVALPAVDLLTGPGLLASDLSWQFVGRVTGPDGHTFDLSVRLAPTQPKES